MVAYRFDTRVDPTDDETTQVHTNWQAWCVIYPDLISGPPQYQEDVWRFTAAAMLTQILQYFAAEDRPTMYVTIQGVANTTVPLGTVPNHIGPSDAPGDMIRVSVTSIPQGREYFHA